MFYRLEYSPYDTYFIRNCGDLLYPTDYPIYLNIQAGTSKLYNSATTTVSNPPSYKEITGAFCIESSSGTAVDVSFNFNGITYVNSTSLSSKSTFLKSTDVDVIQPSLYQAFKANGVFDDYNWVSYTTFWLYGAKYFSWLIRAKNPGNKYKVTSTMYSNYSLIEASPTYYNYVSYANEPFLTINVLPSPTNSIVTDRYYNVVGTDLSQDVEYLASGIIISKNIDSNYVELTTLEKRGFGLADFNVASVIRDDIENWKPHVSNFSLKITKDIDRYMFVPYVKFIDNLTDPNNTYAATYLSSSYDIGHFIDTKIPQFKDYSGTQNYTLEGTAGYLSNLTNQPSYKKLNKSFEFLSHQISSGVNSTAHFVFYYNDNTTETITLNTTSGPREQRAILQLAFKIDTLQDHIAGDFADVYKIDVYFTNPYYNFSSTVEDVIYNTQTYYIDQTVTSCSDLDSEVNYTPLVFKNLRGGFDIFEFEEIQEYKLNRKIETLTVPYTSDFREDSEFEKIYDLDTQKEYTIRTGVLSKEEFEWLKEIGQSNQVYILNLENNLLYPIIITNFEYNYKKDDDLIIKIDFRYSNKDF